MTLITQAFVVELYGFRLNVEQLAEVLGISQGALYNRVGAGTCPVVTYLDSGKRFADYRAVAEHLDACAAKGKDAALRGRSQADRAVGEGGVNQGVPYVLISKFAEMTGYTPRAVELKIARGVWVEGEVWVKAPDGHRQISLAGYARWVTSGKGRTLPVRTKAPPHPSTEKSQ